MASKRLVVRWTHCAYSLVCVLLLIGNSPSHSETKPAKPPKVDTQLLSELRQAVSKADSFEDQFDAQVWLFDMSQRLSRYIKNEKKRLTLLRLVHREAKRVDLPPELVLSVIHVESLFDRFAISVVGAQGLMQVMPFWKAEIGRPDDNLIHMETNLRYGCTILKHYLKREKGDWIRALARYNGSLGRVKYPEKVMDVWQRYWFFNYK